MSIKARSLTITLFGIYLSSYLGFKTGNAYWFLPILLALTVYSTSRAAWVGLLLGLVLAAVAGVFSVHRHILFLGLAAILPVLGCISIYVDDYYQTRVYAIYEHTLSFVDFSGNRTYKNQDSLATGDNNSFRLAWWKIILFDTLRTLPLAGNGFVSEASNRISEEMEQDKPAYDRERTR